MIVIKIFRKGYLRRKYFLRPTSLAFEVDKAKWTKAASNSSLGRSPRKENLFKNEKIKVRESLR